MSPGLKRPRVLLLALGALLVGAPLPLAAAAGTPWGTEGPPGPGSPPPADTIPIDPDTLGPGTDQTPSSAPTDTTVTPGGAFLRSLLLPGWGHAATESHFRGAFYVAVQSGALWMLAKSMARRRQAARFRTMEYEAARERLQVEDVSSPDSLHLLAAGDPRVEVWDERIEARARQVEDWAALGIFLVLLGATDAFVAGHLMDHPEPLSLEAYPRPGGGWTVSGSIRPGTLPFFRP